MSMPFCSSGRVIGRPEDPEQPPKAAPSLSFDEEGMSLHVDTDGTVTAAAFDGGEAVVGSASITPGEAKELLDILFEACEEEGEDDGRR